MNLKVNLILYFIFISVSNAYCQSLEKQIIISSDSTEKITSRSRGGLSYDEKKNNLEFYLLKKATVKYVLSDKSTYEKQLPYLTVYEYEDKFKFSDNPSVYFNTKLDKSSDAYIHVNGKTELMKHEELSYLQEYFPLAFPSTQNEAKEYISINHNPSNNSTKDLSISEKMHSLGKIGSMIRDEARTINLTYSKSFYTYSLPTNSIVRSTESNDQSFIFQNDPGVNLSLVHEPLLNQSTHHTVYLSHIKREGDKGYDYLKEYMVKVYDKERKEIGKTSVTFDYVKDPFYISRVYSTNLNQNETSEGYILLFQKRFGLGKHNDPDKTVHNVLYIDNLGKEIFNYKFNVGLEKPTLEAYYSFYKDNAVYVFGKVIEKNGEFVLLKFTKSGLEKTTKFSGSELKALTVGSGKYGLRSTYGQSLETMGHIFTKDGSVLLYGFNKSKELGSGMGLGQDASAIKSKYLYFDPLILHFSPNMDLVKQYTSQDITTPENNGCVFNMIEEENGTYKFIVQKPLRSFNLQYDDAGLRTSLINLDINNKTINTLEIANPAFEGFFVDGYKYYPYTKRLFIMGKNNSGRYQIEVVKW